MPQAETSETDETSAAHECFIEDQRSPGEHSDVLSVIFEIQIDVSISPPIVVEFFKEDLETIDHDEAASNHHEDHVEEEVSVVVVAHTVIEPRTMVIHLEDTSFTNTETEK